MRAYAMSANGAGVPGVNAKYLEDLSAENPEAFDARQRRRQSVDSTFRLGGPK